MHSLNAGAGMLVADCSRGRRMTSDDMPDWARDMHTMVQILMDRVSTLEFQTEERRDAEILDPSPRAIAEKAERTAKSARDISKTLYANKLPTAPGFGRRSAAR